MPALLKGSMEPIVVPSQICIHCGNPVPKAYTSAFCCLGCEAVYNLIQARGLGQYYQIKDKSVSLRKPQPVSSDKESFSYLDDPEFLRLYSKDHGHTMQFYLEGVHCVACVWLTEKLPDLVPQVRSAHLDLGSSVATVQLKDQGGFNEVAQEFSRFGYRPHPVKEGDAELLQKKENRLLLIQTAVAGACAGNIMLLAVSLYAGAAGELAFWFRWVSFALCLPVVLFSALPFYKNAWIAFKIRKASMDIPIVLGTWVAFASSFVNLFTGSDHIYFDSISALIFLLLASRYVLRKTQQTALHSSHLLHFLMPSVVRRRNKENSSFEEVRVESLISGDCIEVLAGELIPADGIVLEGRSSLNNSLLTGESGLESVEAGSSVFAGTLNERSPLVIRITSSGASTRIGQILKSVEESLVRKAGIVAFLDRVSKIFVGAVLALVGVAFYYGAQDGWQEGLNRALALAIVTCPCAFALATPLAFSVSIGRAARNGILIKGADALEKLSQVKTIFLDKTGTLTNANFEVTQWISHATTGEDLARIIVALESLSPHPVARALVRYFKPRLRSEVLPVVENFEEMIGKGVRGRIGGWVYQIRSWGSPPGKGTQVALLREDELLGIATLGDRLRDDSAAAVTELHRLGYDVRILSGDGKGAVEGVARKLGVRLDKVYSSVSPEQKSSIVQQFPKSMMVGDGANDSVSLASSFVGVAVHSGMEISLRAADVYICTPGVMPIVRLLSLSRETMRVIRRNFLYSIVYNLLGVAAAILGLVTPLFAAVLMPISAVNVFFSSMAGTRKMRKLFREVRR